MLEVAGRVGAFKRSESDVVLTRKQTNQKLHSRSSCKFGKSTSHLYTIAVIVC